MAPNLGVTHALRAVATVHSLYIRAETSTAATAASTTATSDDPINNERPAIYKAIGIALAVGSGAFIGCSFVLKKVGLLRANEKYNEVAGEGYGYLKNAYWWAGMTLMVLGEGLNFAAYAFTDAILVTPLGALSVVLTTILSSIFLKERLSMVGKVACFLCIIGSVVIVMNAPAESAVANIQQMQRYVVTPGFLSYAGVIIVGAVIAAFWAGPRWGNKNMFVYISICSWIGGLSVVATQGLGAAIIAQASGMPQFNQWFLYVLLVFVIGTLLTEIIYLNKALNIFNAAMVTPTYYVYFTSTTIITSAVLFQGFKGTPTSIVTVVNGFLTICSGVVLLQLSKSAKDVPDTAVFAGGLDQIHTIAEQEQPESEPKADAIRGTAAIMRRLSRTRQKKEIEEFERLREERRRGVLEPVSEDGPEYEWDGLRRRKTMQSLQPSNNLSPVRTFTTPLPSPHPPLGMSRFPDEAQLDSGRGHDRPLSPSTLSSAIDNLRTRARGALPHGRRASAQSAQPSVSTGPDSSSSHPAVQLREMTVSPHPPASAGGPTLPPTSRTDDILEPRRRSEPARAPNLAPVSPQVSVAASAPPASVPRPTSGGGSTSDCAPTPPPHATRRQFSFQRYFMRPHSHDHDASITASPERSSRARHSRGYSNPRLKDATEEEQLGLVAGDSRLTSSPPPLGGSSPRHHGDEDEDSRAREEESLSPPERRRDAHLPSSLQVIGAGAREGRDPLGAETDDDLEEYQRFRARWEKSRRRI